MARRSREAIAKVREANGEWTGFHLMLNEALAVAEQGIAAAHQLAARVHDLADNEAARVKREKR
jgi:hypothetical protein